MKVQHILLVVCCLVVRCLSVLGVSTYPYNPNYTTTSFKCILSSGYKDAVFTVLQSKVGIKTQYVQSLINIKNAGLNVTLSFIPCITKSATQQAQDFIKKMNKTLYERVWVQPSDNKQDTQCSWAPATTKTTQAQQNCQYLTTILQQLKKSGIKTGIVTSSILWSYYFKNTCYQLSSEPLYWLYPDDIPSFQGFYPFAGWKAPAAKEYGLSEHVCQILIDFYYHP